MDLESEFGNLSIKFLFVSENPSELNLVLNDLNSLDYKYQRISNEKSIVQLIDSLSIKIPSTSDSNIIIKSCNLIKQLITKQKISLPEVVSTKVVNWIINILRKSSHMVICEALDVLSSQFKKNLKAVESVSRYDICKK